MSDTKFITENESNLQDLERGETEPGEAGNLLTTENPSAQQIDISGIAGKEFSIRAAAYIIDIVIIILFSMLFIFIAGFLMGYIFPRFGLWFDESHERSFVLVDLLRGNLLAIFFILFTNGYLVLLREK